MKLKLALPKGSLEKQTFELFGKAYLNVQGHERTYRPKISDPEVEVRILRPQEIPIYVSEGIQDAGITGKDWIEETGSDVSEVLELGYGKVRLVAAVPRSTSYESVQELIEKKAAEGSQLKIATEYLNITSRWIMSFPSYKKYCKNEPEIITPWYRRGKDSIACIYLSFGATEAKPPDIADIIVDVTETGTTLEQNNLKIIDTVMTSTAHLIASKDAIKDKWKKEKLSDIAVMLRGVTEAEKRLHIFVNVREENLKKLLDFLPALRKPTISKLSESGWYAINTVIQKDELPRIVPFLRKFAQGLVVHEPQHVLSLEES